MEDGGTRTPRQGVRTPLAGMPVRPEVLRPVPFAAVTNLTRDNSPGELPPGYLSPAPSPDEMVIRQRGRRTLPVTWSPDIEMKRNSTFYSAIRTPPKVLPTAHRNLRSTPRKRLLMGDPAADADKALVPETNQDEAAMSTPQKNSLFSPMKSLKRLKLERRIEDNMAPLELALKALSSTQLIEVIRGMVDKRPELEAELRSTLPAPDLKPLEERLNDLRRNIYRCLPTSRLTSKTDSPAYGRAATHLAAFKKCVVEQSRALIESQYWGTVLEYVLMAWGYVRATPSWDNHPHNAVRRGCFKSLSSCCMTALKRGIGTLQQAEVARLHEKLQDLSTDSDDIRPAINFVRQHLQTSSSADQTI